MEDYIRIAAAGRSKKSFMGLTSNQKQPQRNLYFQNEEKGRRLQVN